LLGAQAFGGAGVDKRIDVLATALAGKLTLDDLAELDLAYAPPYSTANDPINLAAFIGLNDLSGFSPLVSAAELKAELAKPEAPLVLDVRTLGEYEASHLAGAVHIPVDDLRFEVDRVPKNRRILVHCRSGFRAHLAVRILKQPGFADVANVTGGHLSMLAEGGFNWETY
jgi:rhodanese-related sulfurtransferase